MVFVALALALRPQRLPGAITEIENLPAALNGPAILSMKNGVQTPMQIVGEMLIW